MNAKPARDFLKAMFWDRWSEMETGQKAGLPLPPLEKPYPAGADLVALVSPQDFTVGTMPLVQAIRQRRSRRKYASQALSLEELSFLLWATQGLSGNQAEPGDVLYQSKAHLRTVPSGGARHPFETYLIVRRVEAVTPGLYRYLPLEHKLLFMRDLESISAKTEAAWGGRSSLSEAAAVFLWAAIPYRTEWRYSVLSPRLIALDAGHICQNLYLAAEAIGAGTCAIAAYDQAPVDAILDLDGEEEFVVYLAPVGKVTQV